MSGNPFTIDVNDCSYTQFFCEENIWKLCYKIKCEKEDKIANAFAVFISNENRCIPLWSQKASDHQDGFIVWDYHVILVWVSENGSVVYDFDSRLPFPCSFEVYLNKCLCTARENTLLPQYNRRFRIIRAADYLEEFSSDRRHMKSLDGSWIKPPPCYPPIFNKDHNLDSFISMSANVGVGRIVNMAGFESVFSTKQSVDCILKNWLST